MIEWPSQSLNQSPIENIWKYSEIFAQKYLRFNLTKCLVYQIKLIKINKSLGLQSEKIWKKFCRAQYSVFEAKYFYFLYIHLPVFEVKPRCVLKVNYMT